MHNLIVFRTNDPQHHEGQIEVIVQSATGGITASPQSVVFRDVAVGQRAQQLVTVLDAALEPRSIARIVCTDPDHVQVRLLPGESTPLTPASSSGERLLGHLEVTFNTNQPGEFNSEILLHLSQQGGRRPDAIPVTARIVAPVELLPSALVLPRTSSEGPVYGATCLCRSTNGHPLQLTLDSIPAGLTAVLEESTGKEPSLVKIRISWEPGNSPRQPEANRRVIRFRAQAGEIDTIIMLPVLLQF